MITIGRELHNVVYFGHKGCKRFKDIIRTTGSDILVSIDPNMYPHIGIAYTFVGINILHCIGGDPAKGCMGKPNVFIVPTRTTARKYSPRTL